MNIIKKLIKTLYGYLYGLFRMILFVEKYAIRRRVFLKCILLLSGHILLIDVCIYVVNVSAKKTH